MSTTVVSGYWNVPNKYSSEKFREWFKTTLRVNCPYVIFSDRESLPLLRQCREGLETVFIERELKDFKVAKYRGYIRTDPLHVPSVELSLIWHEKIFLMEEVARMNPFRTEWFAWLDAGISCYRDRAPPPTVWPKKEKVEKLPTDKLIFTAPSSAGFVHNFGKSYYHYVTGTFMATGEFLCEKYARLYQQYLDNLLPHCSWRYVDQVVHTHIYRDHRDLFHCIGVGYGGVATLLE
jgi:hypothetical protein